jgi:hypothetical protein
MHLAALVMVAFLAGAPDAPAAGCPPELFRIARSKNANVIVYEANAGAGHGLDAGEPVRASWIMLAKSGEREELNFLERLLAYGFEVHPASPGPGFWLTLKAKKDRPLRVLERGGCPAAIGEIGGRRGILKRIYVKADDRQLVPPVEYVEVFGVDPETGGELYERIVQPRNESARLKEPGGG